MRRAGYDVRVLPEEDLGWEENPPTLIEFIRRDQRWCQGTLQYGYFLFMPGMKLVSRFQLAFAMLMFLGSPAWIGLLVVGTLALAAVADAGRFHPAGRRPCAARDHPGHVVCAEDRDRDRRADAAEASPRLRRHRALPRQRRDRDGVLHPAVADHVDLPHAVPRRAAVRPGDRLDRPGARRSHRAVVAGVACSCGRTPRSALARSASSPPPIRPRSVYAFLLAGGPALSIPLAVFTARPALGPAARAHRHRPAAGGNRAAARAHGARACPRSPPPRARPRAMLETLRTARGVMRSLGIYYGWHQRRRSPAMDALYAQLRQARRSGVRRRRPCRRPRRRVPPARRQGGGGRAAARARLHAQHALRPRLATSSSSATRSAARPATSG